MRAVCLLVLFVTGGLGCGSSAPTGLAADLPGTTWTVERIVLDDGDVLRGDGDEVTFAADGSISVSSCNVCNGRYRMRADQLEIEPLACTRRGCPPNDVELERYLTGALSARRDGSYLVLDARVEAGGAQILLVPAGSR